MSAILPASILWGQQEDVLEESIFAEDILEKAPSFDISIGLNTFPQELLGLMEYNTKTIIGYYAGFDFGYESVGLTMPINGEWSADKSYTDISAGISFSPFQQHYGFYAQLGYFTRLKSDPAISDASGLVGRINYKLKFGRRMFLSAGLEMNAIFERASHGSLFDVDLMLIRVGYRIGGNR